jgi:primosomal protein N' (replication factor Y)
MTVLGSATPSMQSAYNARSGKYRQVNLYERVDNRVLPEIVVEDLTTVREEQGARRFLTPSLVEAIQTTLARREQVLLFLNRRGFAGTLVCAACGEPMRCDRCDISLTYHQQSNAYKCHYCGFARTASSRCTRCGSERIKRLGLGTEKLETHIRALFPAARVARMDRDTTMRKGALLAILKGLRERRIDILIGTQMVAKGHDFPFITLVGIICADLSLSLPDFRAGERTFQILAQVAGRAGRGESPGRVILQTYNPDHFSVAAARQQDFEAFYRQEIEFRKALQYPPFSRLIQIRISGRDKTAAAGLTETVGRRCRQLIASQPIFAQVELLGPAEAPLFRIADNYRWQLLLKAPQADALHRLVNDLLFGAQAIKGTSEIKVQVDVDPLFLM